MSLIPKEVDHLLRTQSLKLTLTEAQHGFAMEIGRRRQANHRATDLNAGRTKKWNADADHQLGAIGEVAASVYHPAFAFDLTDRPGGDKGKDCVIAGSIIDIKTRAVVGYELQVRTTHVHADYFLLAYASIWDRDVYLVGFTDAATVRAQKPVLPRNSSITGMNFEVCPGIVVKRPVAGLLQLLGLEAHHAA